MASDEEEVCTPATDSISERDLQSVVEQIVSSTLEEACETNSLRTEQRNGHSEMYATLAEDAVGHSGARPKTSIGASGSESLSTVIPSAVGALQRGGEEKLRSWRDAGLALKQALTQIQKNSDYSERVSQATPLCSSCDCDSMNQMLAEYHSVGTASAPGENRLTKNTANSQNTDCKHFLKTAAKISREKCHPTTGSQPHKFHRKFREAPKKDSQAGPSLSELTQSLRIRLQQINANVAMGISSSKNREWVDPRVGTEAASTRSYWSGHHGNVDASSSEGDLSCLSPDKPCRQRSWCKMKGLANTQGKSFDGAKRTAISHLDSRSDSALSADCSSHLLEPVLVNSTATATSSGATYAAGCQADDHVAPRLASFTFSSDSSELSESGPGLGQLLKVCESPQRKCRPARRKSANRTVSTHDHCSNHSAGTGSESDFEDGVARSERCKQVDGFLAAVDSQADLADIESMYEEENDVSLQQQLPDLCSEEKETSVEKLSVNLAVPSSSESQRFMCTASDDSMPEADCGSSASSESAFLAGRMVSSDREIRERDSRDVRSVASDCSGTDGETAEGLASHLCVEKYKKDKANRRLKMQSMDEEHDCGRDIGDSIEELEASIGDILNDWTLNWAGGFGSDSDCSQPDIQLTESELHPLPEIGSETPECSSSDGDADDEFECECCMCRIEKPQEAESLCSRDEERELMAEQPADDVEYYPDMRDGYDGAFGLSLADLRMHSVLDLEPTIDSLSDVLETMFHNVIVQMLAVYPELLTEGAAPPLDQAAIDAIPTLRVSHGETEETTCSICLCDFESSEEVKQLSCQHLFHRLCVQAWLQKSGTCPVCRNVLHS